VSPVALEPEPEPEQVEVAAVVVAPISQTFE